MPPLAISDNYIGPTMNIHNSIELSCHNTNFSIFPLPPRYGEETRVFEKREEVGSREMVLIGSRIANESLKFALVTCSFRREMFP